ncbi:MAG: hypothetical protein FJW21_04545 [Acidimicrobiia bacterium]|nr:hypothetical protein [Acidimicrobiia bacterium]
MTGWLALGGLVGVLLAGFAFIAMLFAFMLFVLKSVFWLVLLPFRLIGWAVGAVFMLIGTVIAIALGLAMLLAPLLPLAIVAGIGYGIYRMVRKPQASPYASRT